MRAIVLALLCAGCVIEQPQRPQPIQPPPSEVMEPCRQPIKPSMAPAREQGMDVFAHLRAVSRFASDVQLAREDTVDKLQECASRLVRAQDWIRAFSK